MARQTRLVRLLHVDAMPVRAARLAGPRTASLHGWGSPLYALLALPFARWKPGAQVPPLVRRAALIEGGTAQGAAVAWQIHCQSRWLAAARPPVVAWPWENHGWERALVRTARAFGIRLVGYQHSVVGGQMLNYAAHSNSDGLASLPDQVLCSGAATLEQLAVWDFPRNRLAVGGARRFAASQSVPWDEDAPVFVALPFDGITAAEMVEAVREAAARTGRHFVVKDHPMTPFTFPSSPGVESTTEPLAAQKSVSAVVYAATTVGLEAALMGLPTLRFRPRSRIALNILPYGVTLPTTSAATLAGDLEAVRAPCAPTGIFGAVDEALWIDLLSGAGEPT
jgi:hypothetical protein